MSLRAISVFISAFVAGVLAASHALADQADRKARDVATSRPAPAYAIRVANSDDGLKFVDSGSVLIADAAAPAVVRLPGGDLLVVCEHAGPDGKVGLWATRSPEGGKSWLPARAIELRGLPDKTAVTNPSLVSTSDGRISLFFCASQMQPAEKRAGSKAAIRSATTRNGLAYEVARHSAIECPGQPSAQPVAFWGSKGMIVFVAAQPEPGAREPGPAHQFLSADGQSFSRPDRARFSGQIGHVLQLDEHHWRMYVASGTEIRSRISNDGIRWRDEEGIRLRGGFAPAAVQLTDRKYLMLYCAPEDPKQAAASQLAVVNAGKTDSPDAAQDAVQPPAPGSAAQSSAAQLGWDDFAPDRGEPARPRAGVLGSEDGPADATAEAPMPDFINHFDYVGWFKQNHQVPADQNAYYSYGDLPERLHALTPEDSNKLFNDMLNGGVHSGPPTPWSANDHPEWEASYQATQDLVSLFRAGGTSGLDYSTPLQWPDETAPEDRLLVNTTLYPMAGFRRMTKAVLSQAWRSDNGVVPPDQMRDSLEMVLGNATQLNGSGGNLIQRLVGCAERSLTEDTARWALRQNVFATPEEIETTLKLLKEKDTPVPDPAGWITAETTWVKEMAQYAYVPDENGQPKLDPERARKIISLLEGTPVDKVEVPPDVLETSVDQVRDAINEVDGYYQRMAEVWRSSYPGPPSENTDVLAEEINERNPIAGKILASGDRAYHIMQRTEASRRVTQLIYNVELFKARNGRHPTSLDELPADQIADIRTDPFNSKDFVYRLTESGPVIYSASVNGRDDGGLHSPNWGDREDGSGSDDYVFWPPQE